MLKQGQYLKQLQKLSPQQIQFMKMLQIPTVNIQERIQQEMEANPALEEGEEEEEDELKLNAEEETTEEEIIEEPIETEEPEEKEEEIEVIDDVKDEEVVDEKSDDVIDNDIELADYMDDDEIAEYKLNHEKDPDAEITRGNPIPLTRSFHEYLEDQLSLMEFDDREHQLADYIIGSIDDDGYIRRPLEAMVDDIAFGLNIQTNELELNELLKQIQNFDPPGVGARDLKECLVLQLQRKSDHPEIDKIAIKILDEHYDEFVKKHYDKLQKELALDDISFKAVMERILKLNPKPGSAYVESSNTEVFLLPDFYITNTDGELELTLNGINVPDLRISSTFKEMMKEYSLGTKKDKKQKEAVMFIKQKIDSAKWFIDAIRQRQQTLMLTMTAIMNYQKEYFLTGDDTKLKPMILKDIADRIQMDISTISRVSNSKYVQTEFGTFKLKSFFSESLSTDSGDEVSTREVKKILTDLMLAEDKRKPLSDQKLTKLLNAKGYNIARRTVAKYREQLDIPVARLRKEL
jgi:RNA polymerase sigma-54 factor